MDLNNCDEKIVKIGENHVEVQKVLYDKKGKEVIVSSEAYGKNRIDKEREEIEEQIEYWDKVNKEEEKAKVQAKLERVNLIQTEMNK